MILPRASAFVLCAALGCGCPGPGPVRNSPGPADGTSRPRAGKPAGPWDVSGGVEARDWRYVVVHHSATAEGSAAAFDRYHRQVKGWEELAYHFVIGNGKGAPDGAVEVGARWKGQRAGAHAGVAKYNDRGIGVCLVGDFERSLPTKKQIEALKKLLAFLMERFRIPPENVLRHRDVTTTKCPGRFHPWPLVR